MFVYSSLYCTQVRHFQKYINSCEEFIEKIVTPHACKVKSKDLVSLS